MTCPDAIRDALRAERTATARRAVIALDRLAAARTEAREAVLADAAAETACLAFTGYPN